MQKSSLVLFSSALVALSSFISTSARADDFVNGSFESPSIMPGTWLDVSGTDVPGWTYYYGAGAIISNGYAGTPEGTTFWDTKDGSQCLYMNTNNASALDLEQSVHLSAGLNTLTFMQSDFKAGFADTGGELFLEVINPDGTTLVGSTDFTTPAFSDFIQQSLKFTAATSGNYTFILSTAGGKPAILDNFQVNAVPEPGSLALVGLGGLALLRRRRSS